ncbi:major royal jelly protein [Gluconacetobacter sacchari DSM 12717]|nr:major royal jelly family protein [Gluconacetobacter sacchari]GBQ33674.1 major royal jelly protein [Gluconacetobacter sacchari DSM 12717]
MAPMFRTRSFPLRVIPAALALSILPATPPAMAAKPAPPLDPSAPMVAVAESTSQVWTALAVLPDGRMILDSPAWTGAPGPTLTLRDTGGATRPFPNAAWTDPATAPEHRLVSAESLQLADDGTLWVLDSGLDAADHPVAPPKLVQIDTRSATVTRTWPIDPAVLRPGSHVAGVRVGRGHAFILDSGVPGLIVLDLDHGPQRRLMDHHPSLTAQHPIIAGGHVVRDGSDRAAIVNATEIEISPDGQWLYYQPPCGPLYRIGTDLLTDPTITSFELDDSTTLWYKTPPLGGMTVARDGTLYFDDVSTGSIFRFTAGRVYQRIVVDPRLRWPAAPAITAAGQLYIPTAQLDRTPRFNHGQMAVQWPLTIYRIDTAALPAPVR